MQVTKRKSIRLSRFTASLLLGVGLILPLRVLAAEQPDQTLIPLDLLETFDAPHDYLSEKFVSLVGDIDRFFGDDRNYQESNKSVFQLDLTRVAGYGGDSKYVLSGRAKVQLPTTEKRLHLLLETDPEGNVTGESTQGQSVINNRIVSPGSVAVAARYEKAEENRWFYSTDAGVHFRGITTSPNPFMRARVSYSVPMEQWRMKTAETVFWFNSIGVGETTQFDLERILSEPVLFRASSNATWLHDKQNFDLRQDFSIYQTLNERNALLYQASAIGVSNPQVQVTEYVVLMLYRYRLHQNWMFFELSPQLHFPKAENFKMKPTLSMRLEMLFDESK